MKIWAMMGKISIKYKILLLTMSVSLGSIGAVGFLSVNSSNEALLVEKEDMLEAIRVSRQVQIEDYFKFIHHQIFNFSQNRMVTEATSKFAEAFHKAAEQVAVETGPGSDVYQSLKSYFDNEFQPRLKEAGQAYRGADTYMPEAPSARILLSQYLATNPNPVGSKHQLDASEVDCEYNKLHATYHPRIRDFLESFEYYDIFLFDLEGNLVYSVFKETDYSTNFESGPYAQSNFGHVYREARNGSQPGEIFIEDFKPYEPSYGAAASFTGSPVFHDGVKVGVAIFQMPVGKINSIMNLRDGMGESGETFLVNNNDLLMRSESRFSEDSTILTRKIDTDAVRNAAIGKKGTEIIDDYHGTSVVSSYSPLQLEGLNWSILAEMELAEVTAHSRALRNHIVAASALAAAVAGVIAFFFSLSLIRPIYPIVVRAKEIADGNLTGDQMKIKSEDELGQLTQSMNDMSKSLRQLVSEVAESANSVADASNEIASGSQELTKGVSEQSNQITQVSAAIEQMSASVMEVARMSTDAAGNATASGELAQAGGKVVDETIQGMEAISQAVSAGAESVTELGKRGEQIGQIIEVINDIADQTNLLALNAAIEAARAGEHGRGFAVVADEVRKLADRTTNATDEIAQSIKAIQTETSEAVQRMDTGTQQVQTGVGSATQAGESLGQIVNGAKEVAGMIQSIAAAAEQQSAAAEEVSASIDSISQISTQAEGTTKQTAESASGLAERASRLQALIGQFRLNEG